MKLYVASSWRNEIQPKVVETLRSVGHEVYDFKNPKDGNTGFRWLDIDSDWQKWTPEKFREFLDHPIAQLGFMSDYDAMLRSDAGVLVMPCGRSAHLEAGYFVGANKPLYILLSSGEPELMYNMATDICVSLDELVRTIPHRPGPFAYRSRKWSKSTPKITVRKY